MNTLNIDIDSLPERATLMDWSRALRAGYPTILKYYKLGKLKGERQPDLSMVVDKADIIRCFKLCPKKQPVTA